MVSLKTVWYVFLFNVYRNFRLLREKKILKASEAISGLFGFLTCVGRKDMYSDEFAFPVSFFFTMLRNVLGYFIIEFAISNVALYFTSCYQGVHDFTVLKIKLKFGTLLFF